MDIAALRILEVGDAPLFKRVYPQNTVAVWMGNNAITEGAPGWLNFTLGRSAALRRMLSGPDFDLVVCTPPLHAPWDPRWIVRALFNRHAMAGSAPLVRGLGNLAVRGRIAAPIVVIDRDDPPFINRHNFHLLDRCRAWFKRELPTDNWRVFLKTAHANLPTPRLRRAERFRRRLARLRPISLGLRYDHQASMIDAPREKSVDVFFGGLVENNSTVRARGIGQLQALRGEGISIDIADRPLPLAEFYERCARARLVWSPEGLGWDCFRHYEAAACFSVPLISQPTIERHQPLREGVHAFYYDIEGDGLARTLRAALADGDRLAAMAQAARAHVMAHHTEAALCRYIVDTAFAGASVPARPA